MKKINVLMLGVLILFSGFFASCKKDTTGTAPEITFDAATNPVTLGTGVTSYAITGTIYTAAGLDIVKVFIMDASGGGTQDKSINSFSAGEVTTTDKMNYVFRFNYTGIVSPLRIQIRAIDKNGVETDSEILVINPLVASDLTSYVSVILGGSSNATVGSSFASADGSVYILADAKTNYSKVDYLFFYGTSNLATLASPTDVDAATVFSSATNGLAKWTARNDTKLKLVTDDFDNITSSSSITDVSATGSTKVNNLAVGNVVAFKTAATSTNASKKGLIKVLAISGSDSGTITIKVLVQK